METVIYRVKVTISPKEYKKIIETLVCKETTKSYRLEDPTLYRTIIKKSGLCRIQEGMFRQTDSQISFECYCLESDVENKMVEVQSVAHKELARMWNNVQAMWENIEDEAKTIYKLRSKSLL